jgi:hypothetical protein
MKVEAQMRGMNGVMNPNKVQYVTQQKNSHIQI